MDQAAGPRPTQHASEKPFEEHRVSDKGADVMHASKESRRNLADSDVQIHAVFCHHFPFPDFLGKMIGMLDASYEGRCLLNASWVTQRTKTPHSGMVVCRSGRYCQYLRGRFRAMSCGFLRSAMPTLR